MRELFRPLLQFVEHTSDQWTGRTPVGAERSSDWQKVRSEWLKAHPQCAGCGGTSDLRVHHVVPFWVDSSLELDPSNLITLCEAKKYGINCHLLLGHFGNWQKWNPTVQVMAPIWNRRIHEGLESYVRRFVEYANGEMK
jgi:hypothetical protein